MANVIKMSVTFNKSPILTTTLPKDYNTLSYVTYLFLATK